MVSAYILFGLLHISYQVENPFGYDWNDLDLDRICRNLAIDLDLIASQPPRPDANIWLYNDNNQPLWPLQNAFGFKGIENVSVNMVREKFRERHREMMEFWERGAEKKDQIRKHGKRALGTYMSPPRLNPAPSSPQTEHV